MVAGKIWSGNGYQRENQTNIGWAGNRLTDSGFWQGRWQRRTFCQRPHIGEYAEIGHRQKPHATAWAEALVFAIADQPWINICERSS